MLSGGIDVHPEVRVCNEDQAGGRDVSYVRCPAAYGRGGGGAAVW